MLEKENSAPRKQKECGQAAQQKTTKQLHGASFDKPSQYGIVITQ